MICDICHEEPAVYGDGVSFSHCAKCHLAVRQEQPDEPAPLEMGGEPHKTIAGLTSIILPIYNIAYPIFHYTGTCIGTIREHTDHVQTPYELIIVDNGSTIKVPDMHTYYANKVIVNEKNEGVTKAWNQGIRASFGEYIVLINSDVQVFDHWMEGLKDALDNQGYDLVMAHPMYSLTEPFARAIEANAVWDGSKKFDPVSRDFSCIMFKKSLLDEIGLFDEDFFSYCSDSEICDRMDKFGKKYGVIDRVATSHIADATGYSMGEETNHIMDKDKETYDRKKNQSVEPKIDYIIQENPAVVEYTQGGRKLIRSKGTGDKLYIVIDGLPHPIKDPQTLHALGFDFGQDEMVDLIGVNIGEEINMANVGEYATI